MWVLLLCILQMRWCRGRLIVDGREKASHVECKVDQSIVVGHSVHRSEVDAFLSRVGRYVSPDLFQKMKDLPTTKVCWRGPLLRSGIAEEDLRKKVVMNSIPAEALPALSLRKLNGKIRVPDLFP